MANVNDVRRAAEQPAKQLSKLDDDVEAGRITEADGEAIRAAWERYRKSKWSAPLTQKDRLTKLRMSAIRGPKPLLDYEGPADVDANLAAQAEAGAQADDTQRAYYDVLSVFFQFLDAEPEYPDYDWFEATEPPEVDREKKDPDDMLDEAEVVQIRTHMAYPRGKAFVELMTDIGTRVAATCQLRVGDLDLDVEPPTVRLNPEGASQKGADGHVVGRVDLKDSTKHVRTYVREHHPEAPEPPDDAPLFPIIHGYDPDDRQNCAAAPRTMQDQIDKAADGAGIAKPVNHHSFKHACVKRLKWKYGLDWDEIGDRVLWSEESLHEMMITYGRLNEEERREKIRQKMGLEEGSDDGEVSTEIECQTCGTTLPRSENYCGQCGNDPLDPPRAKPGPTIQGLGELDLEPGEAYQTEDGGVILPYMIGEDVAGYVVQPSSVDASKLITGDSAESAD